MRYAGEVLSGALFAVKNAIKVGITTLELDTIAEQYILSHNCKPAFKGLYGYKFTTNTSVNEEIIHGLPGERTLQNGDIISVDCGATYNGINTDACRTFAVGTISKTAENLITTTQECFNIARNQVKIGAPASVVGVAIEKFLPKEYSILHNYFGHGIGKVVHDDPLIAHYIPKELPIKQALKMKFLENTAICIEPMILLGADNSFKTAKDKWTIVSQSGNITAHYENTILITKHGTEILTNKYC
jgi:methionyl aminopeptidase